MMLKNNRINICVKGVMFAFVMYAFGGCQKVPRISPAISNVVNITPYLQEHPDSFSEFSQMISMAGYADMLGAYGNYTLFLPDNSAVNAFLKSRNKSSVADLDSQEVKDIVQFHILNDTVNTISFTDGKLPVLTLYGQYLVTGVANVNGESNFVVNRQANIIRSNIRVGNGVIHVIDHVLQPAQYTLAQLIANNPEYSIFTQALKATGFYDTLNILPANNPDSAKAWLTVLAESDSVYNSAGIHSFADLMAQYSNTGDPQNVNDSMHLYMAYHIIYGADYLADIISNASFNTLAPAQVITTKLTAGDSVLINDQTFNGTHEPGVMLSRAGGDISATNGVLQDATGNIFIRVIQPFPVYWDVCREPDIMNKPYYGKQKFSYNLQTLPKFINDPEANYFPAYVYGGDPFIYGDYLQIPLGVRRSPWIEFTTPLIVKGKYKVWVCYRTAGRDNICQVTIDGVPMQRTFNHHVYMPGAGTTDAEREAEGWKYYTADESGHNNNWASFLLGTVTITTTGTHTIRFTNLSGTDSDFWLDMIQFIPVNMDQLLPRFNPDGTPYY